MTKDTCLLRKKKFICLIISILTLAIVMYLNTIPSEAAEKDLIFVEDQYGKKWNSGEMMTTNIFASIVDPSVDSPTKDKKKLIAPGTSGAYSFTIHNNSDESIDYFLVGRNENENEIPLDFNMHIKDGSWIIGRENSWVLWKTAFPLDFKRTLSAGDSDTINLKWQWPYERGQDAQDTQFGERALTEELNYKLSLNVLIETSSGKQPSVVTNKKKSVNNYWRRLPQTGEEFVISIVIIGIITVLIIYPLWRVTRRNNP